MLKGIRGEKIKREKMSRDGRDGHFSRFSPPVFHQLPSRIISRDTRGKGHEVGSDGTIRLMLHFPLAIDPGTADRWERK